MTPKESSNIEQVCKKLLKYEENGWNDADDYIVTLEGLDDHQLWTEAYILFQEHETKHIVPDFPLPNAHLFARMMLDAVPAILESYKNELRFVSDKHRYILQQYLALEYISRINMCGGKRY